MNDLDFRNHFLTLKLKFFFLALITSFILGLTPIYGAEVLIFSSNHNNDGVTKLKKPEGKLQLEVSSFLPIKSIRINGEEKTLTRTSYTQMEIPYQLHPGENKFEIIVTTDAEEVVKEFVLDYTLDTGEETSKKEKSPWQLITMLTTENTDNVNSVSDSQKKEVSQKIALTLVPGYRLALDEDSDINFQGILLTEKRSKEEDADNEIVFIQFTTGYQQKAGFGNWALNLGGQKIGSDGTNPFQAETEVENNQYMEMVFKVDSSEQTSFNGIARALKKDSIAEPESDAYDEDGVTSKLDLGWDQKMGSFKTRLNAILEQNDALGRYIDESSAKLTLRLNYSLSKQFNLGGTLSSKTITAKEEDPAEGVAEKTTQQIVSFKAIYQLSSIKGMLGSWEVRREAQTSNIDVEEYKSTFSAATLIYMF